jgi:hypothetical protein
MESPRLTGAVPALAVAAVVSAVLGLAACGSSSTPAPTQEELNAQACAAYCTSITGACTAANAQFASADACNAYCVRARGTPEIWSAGADGATSGDTLACRVTHAGLAGANAAVHCPHAGPSGGNACGNWCEDYCDLALAACTGGLQLYADRAACQTACAAIPATGTANATSGNTVQCRIYHLGVAASSAAQATVHCPHGNPTPTGPCT